MKPGLFIRTFGCQMNEYDSAKLAKLLSATYERVERVEDAEVAIVNTCSVRDKPEQKLYSWLGELREFKLRNPRLLVGVGGCVAQQEGERIVKRSPTVDFVFGTHNLSLVPSLIERRRHGSAPQVAIDYRDEWEDLPLGLPDGENKISVFVSISRGCNKSCTYCIVPVTRGPEVSRSMDEIEREVRIAVQRGAREVVLLGQTVNSYGLDFNPRSSFTDLLARLTKIENLWRIRFTSPHPQEVRPAFIDFIANEPKVCRHIHLPLQAGSDKILKSMNRNYRRKRYLQIVDTLKRQIPHLSITTDIIVGFPGETEKDFQETLQVLEYVGYDSSYSFIFSPRPGTAAGNLPDPVPYAQKLEWLKVLQERQGQITNAKLAAWVNKSTEVLVDRYSAHNARLLQGRISQNITVNFEREEPELKPGALISACVTGVGRHTLRVSTELAEQAQGHRL